MNSTLTTAIHWFQHDLRRPAVLISILFSIWVILTNDVINTDGVLYLDTAHQIKHLNWNEAAALYHWNFFPALIALVSTITFLDLESSALLINNLFIVGVTWVFLSALMLMGANHRVQLAGLVIISIHPYINDYRADIIRGPGFWFFILLGTYLLIQARHKMQLMPSILMGLCFAIASLFRIEGIAFVLIGPLILLFGKPPLALKLKLTATVYAIMILLAVIAAGLWMARGEAGSMSWVDNPAGKILHPVRLLSDSLDSLTNEIPQKGKIISEKVLNQHSEDYGTSGVIAVLVLILIATTIKRITLLYFILAIYGHYKNRIQYLPELLGLTLINLAYMAVYVSHHFFLSSRFAMPAALLIALLASYGLAGLFEKQQQGGITKQLLRMLAALVMLFMLLDGLISTGTSKQYIREGARWMQQHLQPGDRVITNQVLVNHYADIRMTRSARDQVLQFERQLNTGAPTIKLFSQADHVAIRIKNLDPKVLVKLESLLKDYTEKEFSSSDKERLVIYSKH